MLGFYRVATPLKDSDPIDAFRFQSRAGFLPRRDLSGPSGKFSSRWFQSRAGFLPRRDLTRLTRRRILTSSFNPVLGFYRVATHQSSSSQPDLKPFQSRAGFLPRRDAPRILDFPVLGCFNPVLGFYRVATSWTDTEDNELGYVSIPCWVSTASRHCDRVTPINCFPVSIPCWVSTASRQQDLLRKWVAHAVSIPCWVSTASRRGS